MVVVAPCRTTMQYGNYKSLSWPANRETPRAGLGSRVLGHLASVQSASYSNPLKRPTAAPDNELEVIQRRLSQQLEQKQVLLRDSMCRQQEELSALRTQLEHHASTGDPHNVKLHLSILQKLEMKRKHQESTLQGLEADYSVKTDKKRTPPVNGHLGLMNYRSNWSPASAALSNPPSLSDSRDTESDSIPSPESGPLTAPCQSTAAAAAATATSFDSHSLIFDQQLNLQAGHRSNSEVGDLKQAEQFSKYQGSTYIGMSKEGCSTDGKPPLPGMAMQKHNGALRVFGTDHVPAQHRSQHHARDILQQQKQQADYCNSTGQKALHSESAAGPLRTFGPHMSGPHVLNPTEHMLVKTMGHRAMSPSSCQQADRTMSFTGPSPTSSYQPIGTLNHRPQRMPDNLHYPSNTYLHQPNPHLQQAHRLPMRMSSNSQQQTPGREYLQNQPIGNTSHHVDSLDHMAATMTGLGSSHHHTSALVTDSILGFDSEELGQYMGPPNNSQWSMGGQRQWQQPINGIGQDYQLPPSSMSQQDHGMRGGGMTSEGYGWL